MSDYISNLVVRNLGWANTVQPRWRSLFEPLTQGAGGTAWEPSQLEEIVSVESIPTSRGLDKQGSKGKENRSQSNWMTTQTTDSQPLSPSSLTPNPSNSAPASSIANRDIAVPESQTISPQLPPPLPFQAEEEGDSGEVLTGERQSQPPLLGQKLTQSESLSSSASGFHASNIAPASSTDDRDLALSESVEEQGVVELGTSHVPKSIRQTNQNTEVSVTANKARELSEELSSNLTSNSHQPKSTQPPPETTSMPAEASRDKVTEAKSVEFLEIERWETEPTPGEEGQPASPIAKIARPQVTSSLVAKTRLPSDRTEPKPPIRVTIGRIEVQAILPPEPPSPPSQPFTPRLSLEEYLKSRQGEGGRK